MSNRLILNLRNFSIIAQIVQKYPKKTGGGGGGRKHEKTMIFFLFVVFFCDVLCNDLQVSFFSCKKRYFFIFRLPLPPGAMMTMWRDPERFKTAYFSKEVCFHVTTL